MQRDSFVIFKNWVDAIDTLPEENAMMRARKGNFRFQMETIDEEKFLYYISQLDGESIFRVVWQLLCNDTIINRPPYILSTCFNLAKENLAKAQQIC